MVSHVEYKLYDSQPKVTVWQERKIWCGVTIYLLTAGAHIILTQLFKEHVFPYEFSIACTLACFSWYLMLNPTYNSSKKNTFKILYVFFIAVSFLFEALNRNDIIDKSHEHLYGRVGICATGATQLMMICCEEK